MAYNNYIEKKKFKEWKEKEEKLLRFLNVEEDTISELHEYDVQVFNKERSIKSRQTPTRDVFFFNIPYEYKKEIKTVSDMLDELSNEALFTYLSQTDQVTLNIVLLKIMGYTAKEIASILNMEIRTVYSKVEQLKKKGKKILY